MHKGLSMNKAGAKTTAKFVAPTILSMVSVFLYTIVDGVFVGRGVGSDALGAVNIAFPYVMFFTAFVMMATIGGLTITAIRMGRGDKEGANVSFMHSLVLTTGIGVVATVIGMFFTEELARLLGADDGYLEPVCDYLYWYSVFLIPCGICSTFNGAARNDDAPVLVSAVTIVATSLNIIGDYVLIFPLGMGVKGAAIATGAAQTVAVFLVLPHFLGKKGVLSIKPVKLDMKLVRKIFLRGAPECISQFASPMSIMLTNIVLSRTLGDGAINAFSVIGYVASFSAAIFIGTAEGIQPLLGRSYGEKNEAALKYYFRAALRISFIGSVIVSVVIYLLWGRFLTLFAVDGTTRECAEYAILRYMPGFLLQAVIVIVNAYLYSTTRTKYAIVINLLRSFVFDTAIILLVPRFFGTELIWLTFAMYEGASLLVAFILLRIADKNGAIGNSAE